MSTPPPAEIAPTARPVPTVEGIRRVLAQHAATLREEYAVATLAVFGSVARGEATPDSDVDLLVTFSHPADLFMLVAVNDFLEEALAMPVQVLMPDGMRPRMRANVERERVRVL